MSNRKAGPVSPIATSRHSKGSTITSGHVPLLLLNPFDSALAPSSKRTQKNSIVLVPHLIDFCAGCGQTVPLSSASSMPDNKEGGDMEACTALPRFPIPQDVPSSIDDEDDASNNTSTTYRICSTCKKDNQVVLSCFVKASNYSTNNTNTSADLNDKDENDVYALNSLMRYLRSLLKSRGRFDGKANALLATCSLMLSMNDAGCNEKVKQALDKTTMKDATISKDKEDDGHDDDDENSEEIWALLRSACSRDDCYYVDFLQRGPLHFSQVVQSIRRRQLFWINVAHPISVYAEKILPTISEDEMDRSLEGLLKPLVDWCFRNDGKRAVEAAEALEELELGSDERPDSRILRYRRVARLSQTVGAPIDDEEEGFGQDDTDGNTSPPNKLLRRFQAISTDFVELPHSCVPNCAIVGSTGTNDQDAMVRSMQPVHLELLALREIEEGEILTVSRIEGVGGLEMSLEERTDALREAMGASYVCRCVRCTYEGMDDKKQVEVEVDTTPQIDEKILFHWKDLKALGDLAMQQGRYSDASELYGLVLNSRPSEGDVLHALAASFLERGSYCQSQRLWQKAYEMCPIHSGIALAARKQDAYGYGCTVATSNKDGLKSTDMSLISAQYVTILERKCFITKPDRSLLTPEECKQAIEWAEDAAAARPGGWSTSRHYAVPTTDLPVHEIPALLMWLNNFLNDRLRPLMATQFGSDEVGYLGSKLSVHDAFIVRYDARRQRHLPIHTDDSTHSFTIALNDVSAYDGGGTYVVCFGRAFRPSLGGVMTFRGDQLQHGGDPVVRGTRYVIVGFLYVSESKLDRDGIIASGVNDVASALRPTKRPKMGSSTSMFQAETNSEQDGAQASGFSFGFQM